MKYTIKKPEETTRPARALLACTMRAAKKRAFVAGLSGDLGAGKTTFVKALAKELGIRRTLQSPTFILERDYKIPGLHPLSARFSHLIHIDAYRLTEHDNMFAGHLQTLMNNPENLILIEWPERIKKILPKDTLFISFAHKDEKTRTVTIR